MKRDICVVLDLALILAGCVAEPRGEAPISPWTSAGLDGGGTGDASSSGANSVDHDGSNGSGGSEGDDTSEAPVDFDPAFVIAEAQAALDAGVPGLAVAVVVDGQLVFAEGFGVADEAGTLVDADTLFNLASISKSITALTVLAQRDAGLLTLDTPVPAVVPGFGLREGFDPAAVHVGHLLTHSAGIGDWPTEPFVDAGTLRESFAQNAEQPLWAPPGVVHVYSNRGFTLAGLVAAEVEGTSFAEAARTRVLEPLGMTGATLDGAVAAGRPHARGQSTTGGWWGPQDYTGELWGPSAGLWAGARDLGRLVQAIATAEGPGLQAALADAASPVQPLHLWPGSHYGYGLFVDVGLDPAMVSHGGSIAGYLSDMQILPELGFGVIAVANGEAWWPGDLTHAVVEHYAGPVGFADAPDTAAAPGLRAGSYHDPWQLGTVVINEDAGGLSAQFVDFGQTVPLDDWGGGSFSCPHPQDGAEMDVMFWPDAAGNAAYLVSRAGIAARQ